MKVKHIINRKCSHMIELFPNICIDYVDYGLAIHIRWVWWVMIIDVIETKHDILGNIRKNRR
jgi:hypothetical protein